MTCPTMGAPYGSDAIVGVGGCVRDARAPRGEAITHVKLAVHLRGCVPRGWWGTVQFSFMNAYCRMQFTAVRRIALEICMRDCAILDAGFYGRLLRPFF